MDARRTVRLQVVIVKVKGSKMNAGTWWKEESSKFYAKMVAACSGMDDPEMGLVNWLQRVAELSGAVRSYQSISVGRESKGFGRRPMTSRKEWVGIQPLSAHDCCSTAHAYCRYSRICEHSRKAGRKVCWRLMSLLLCGEDGGRNEVRIFDLPCVGFLFPVLQQQCVAVGFSGFLLMRSDA